ncbi:hypothetical protein F4808DRAFT_447378 [Astrocystis sublimbata]|nr:hypothetical protein F4808DRAFT_447378 [Astrocystis sublimbata]
MSSFILIGIVFHYGDCASDSHVTSCEAAYLASDPAVSVRVSCSPTNTKETMVSNYLHHAFATSGSNAPQESYSKLGDGKVEELRLDQEDLNTK